jgi:hypothetical protein
MTDVYEAWQLPRGNIVVKITDGDRVHAQVVCEEVTIEEARVEACRWNTQSWLADRPADAPVMEWGNDWEARLLAILDKPYEAELLVAA